MLMVKSSLQLSATCLSTPPVLMWGDTHSGQEMREKGLQRGGEVGGHHLDPLIGKGPVAIFQSPFT